MATTPPIRVVFKADTLRYVAALRRAITAAAQFELEQARLAAVATRTGDIFTRLGALGWLGLPPTKTNSVMTAREYRAARRAYARALRAHRKASR